MQVVDKFGIQTVTKSESIHHVVEEYGVSIILY
jgi:hypothetical protein